MENKKALCEIQAIISLIDSLGLCIEKEKLKGLDAKVLYLASKDNGRRVFCFKDAMHGGNDVFYDYCHILDGVLHSIEFFDDCLISRHEKHKIVNPYLGCKNLQEALIKKDLLSN